ncbi:MAG TPA: helix-turn-helix domain-containing protein [Solirubrobacteraceae bacterium]|jgi:sugar diacid utilization regulator
MRVSATLPPEAADMLRPVLPSLADETIAAIAVEVPDYERAMDGEFGQVVRLGVETALSRFVEVLVGERADRPGARETYVNLGRGEFHAGRSMEALLAAYRVGARLTWRRFVEAGTAGGLPPQALYDLGEAIFEYIDELSAESAEGYAEEQSTAAGESQRRRRRLVRLLAEEPPAAQEAVRTAAQVAGWALPRRLAVVVAAESEAAPTASEEILDAIAARLARRTGAGAIGAAFGGLAVVMLPDPDAPGRRRALASALEENQRAALGPTVSWPEAPASLRRAAAAFRLPTGPGLIVAEEHLGALLLSADPALAADLARTRLAPLAGLAPVARQRLAVTLRAWLDRPGQVQAVAAALDVHPQTVRYRLRQLRELFGSRLEDPDSRFELALALRAAEGQPLLM